MASPLVGEQVGSSSEQHDPPARRRDAPQAELGSAELRRPRRNSQEAGTADEAASRTAEAGGEAGSETEEKDGERAGERAFPLQSKDWEGGEEGSKCEQDIEYAESESAKNDDGHCHCRH